MPFLRVIRDKRGYETTYLIHWFREGTRQRSRILYIFRTPGGVRVGREALDPGVLRDLEARHPEIAFDWKAVIDTRQVIETDPKPRWSRKRREGDGERASEAEVTVTPPPPGKDPPASGVGRAGPGETVAPRLPVPSAVEGSTSEEQIAFLALWYPLVRDRIPQRISDPARRETLLALAERLNPAGWSDADQIAAGLPRAAESLGRLSRVLSRRRRRSRPTPARPTLPVSPAVGVEPPAASGVEPPAASGVEPPTGREEPAQDERAPSGASTDIPSTGE